jgi:copper chaperone CopZ
MARKERVELHVKGMHCTGCETAIEQALKRLPGVEQVEADHRAEKVVAVVDLDQTPLEALRERIDLLGYEVVG